MGRHSVRYLLSWRTASAGNALCTAACRVSKNAEKNVGEIDAMPIDGPPGRGRYSAKAGGILYSSSRSRASYQLKNALSYILLTCLHVVRYEAVIEVSSVSSAKRSSANVACSFGRPLRKSVAFSLK